MTASSHPSHRRPVCTSLKYLESTLLYISLSTTLAHTCIFPHLAGCGSFLTDLVFPLTHLQSIFPQILSVLLTNAIKLLQVTPLENLHGFPVTSSGVQGMRSGSCLPHPDPFGPALPVRACVVGGSSSEACCLPVNTLSSSIPSWIAFL